MQKVQAVPTRDQIRSQMKVLELGLKQKLEDSNLKKLKKQTSRYFLKQRLGSKKRQKYRLESVLLHARTWTWYEF